MQIIFKLVRILWSFLGGCELRAVGVRICEPQGPPRASQSTLRLQQRQHRDPTLCGQSHKICL